MYLTLLWLTDFNMVMPGVYRINGIFRRLLFLCLMVTALDAKAVEVGGLPEFTPEGSSEKVSGEAFTGAEAPLGLPVITLESSMVGFEAESGQEDVQFYSVSASGLSPDQLIFVEVSDPSGSFTISSMTSGYGGRIELAASSDGTLYESVAVRYVPAGAGSHSATITHSGEGVSESPMLSLEGNASSLPVKWYSFTVSQTKGAYLLNWTTASEKNNSHFEIEVSENPLAGFRKIGRVESKVVNSSFASSYNFRYVPESFAGTGYFRLKQVDVDQKFDYSKIITPENSWVNGFNLQVKVSSHPLTVSSELVVTVAGEGHLNMVLKSAGGTEVFANRRAALYKGENRVPLQLPPDLPSGLYLLSVEFQGHVVYLKLLKE